MNIEVINLNDNLPEVDIECANSDDDVCRYTVPTTHVRHYLIDEGETVLFNLTLKMQMEILLNSLHHWM